MRVSPVLWLAPGRTRAGCTWKQRSSCGTSRLDNASRRISPMMALQRSSSPESHFWGCLWVRANLLAKLLASVNGLRNSRIDSNRTAAECEKECPLLTIMESDFGGYQSMSSLTFVQNLKIYIFTEVFTSLVLGCIEAAFRIIILFCRHFWRSLRFSQCCAVPISSIFNIVHKNRHCSLHFERLFVELQYLIRIKMFRTNLSGAPDPQTEVEHVWYVIIVCHISIERCRMKIIPFKNEYVLIAWLRLYGMDSMETKTNPILRPGQMSPRIAPGTCATPSRG